MGTLAPIIGIRDSRGLRMSALPDLGLVAEPARLVPIPNDPEIAALDNNLANRSEERREAALRDDLAAIAAKVGRRITIPARPFTLDEWQTIRFLRSVLRTARVKRTWTQLVFSMTPAQARAIVDEHGGDFLSLGGEQANSEIVELFGASLPLGWFRFVVRQARLANLEEVKRHLDTRPIPPTPIRLRFVPGQDATMEIAYPEWGLTPNSTGKNYHPDAPERIVLLDPDESKRLNRLFNLRARRPLRDAELEEMDALVAKHKQRLLDRGISLFGARNQLEKEEAQRVVEAQIAEAQAWWAEFEADPARVEAAAALARERRARSDG